MRVGVLALQGDFEAHSRAVERAGADAIEVRTREDLERAERLIVPGGESTTLARLATAYDLVEPVRKRIEEGMPVFGTCAGMIACAKRVIGGESLFGVMDISVRRNAYGRQVDSFECDVLVAGLTEPVHAVFIRAPVVEEVGPGVEVLSELGGRPIAVRESRMLACAFHPELTDDLRVHQLFLKL